MDQKIKYQIISDGACDLSDEQIKENNLKVIPFYVSFDNKNYQKVGVDVDVRSFFQQMVDNPHVYPKTSMPSAQDFIDAFIPYIEKGIAIICICITSKMSGSFNSASVAKDHCLEMYPNALIKVINSYTITVLQGLLVLEACRMQRNGLSYEEVIKNIEKMIPSGRILFTVEDLEYLKHGGRIGKLTYIIGSALKIKPIILFNDGEISSGGKAIGQKRAFSKIASDLKDIINDSKGNFSDYLFGIGYGYDIEDSIKLEEILVNSLENENLGTIYTFQIGATIAAHTGPYPIGIGFIKKYDAI